MTVYNTSYKSGAITAISGATITVSGMTPAAGDVGRILVLTSGSGELQHREIVGVSGQDITLAHSFDTNPFIDNSSDSRGSDVNPSVSDTFAISYDVSDLITGDADITQDDQNHLLIASMTAQTGAYIHFKNYHVQLNSTTFKSGIDGGFIFGYYNYVANEDAYTKSSCHIVDVASGTGGDQMRAGANDFGMLDVYGGSIFCPNDLFWRLYWDSGSGAYQARFFDVDVQGGLGGRLDGDRSLLRISAVGDNNTNGIFNVLSNPFRNEVIALDCLQAGYVNLLRGSTGRAVFNRLAGISAKVLNVVLGGSGGPAASAGNVYEVVGKKSEIDAAPAFLTVDSTGAPDHTVRYGNIIKPRFITQNLSLLTGTIATSLLDTNGTLVNSQDVTTGAYPAAFYRHTDLASVAGAQSLSDGTQYAPYTLNAYKYGYQFSSNTVSLEDEFSPNVVFLPNFSIVETDKAVVDARLTVDNNQQLYEAAASWLQDNLGTLSSELVTPDGGLGSFDLDIDATAAQVFAFDGSKITIKSSAYAGLLTTTGAVTLLNGATQTGGIIDSNGDSFLTFEAVDSWIVYASAANRDSNTAPLDSGTGSEIYRFTFSGGTTYYLRLTTGTDIIFKDVTPVASGETVVSLGTSALLGNINASIQESSQLAEYAGRATVDLISGTNSTEYPCGTSKTPTSTIANALIIADDIGVKVIEVRGSSTALPQELNGYELIAGVTDSVGAKLLPQISLTTVSGADNCEFKGFEITGATDVTSLVFGNLYESCLLNGVSGLTGVSRNCKLAGTLQVEHAVDVQGSYGTVDFSVSGTNARLTVPDFSGSMTLSNMASATAVAIIGVVSGIVTIDATCSAGTIVVANADQVVDNSTGASVTILQDTAGGGGLTAQQVWEYDISAIATDGLAGKELLDASGAGSGSDVNIVSVNGVAVTSIDQFKADVSAIPTNPLLTNDARIDRLDVNVSTRLDSASYVIPPTVGEIDTQLSGAHGVGSWATATGFSTLDAAGVQAALAAYGASTFNPATDTVARVSLVDVCTLNTDMRGTDGANTVAPDNATITSISGTVELVRKYHDNNTVFLAADGVTQTTQSLAYSTVTFDDDGTTPLKTVSFRNAADIATALPDATGYKKV